MVRSVMGGWDQGGTRRYNNLLGETDCSTELDGCVHVETKEVQHLLVETNTIQQVEEKS